MTAAPLGSAVDRWEPWRVWFAQNFFTTLQGMGAPVWFRELLRNRFRIEGRYAARAALISVSSPVNSLFAAADDRKFGRAIARTPPTPPIVVLGHWRSGTTLLQRLFALDDRLSYPTFYQCLFPRGFLHSQERNSKAWAGFLPRTRVFDNMENGFDSPAEDEFALCSLTGLSPCMGWCFPRNWDYYDRFLTFRDATEEERRRWKRAIRFFVRKIQFHAGRRVVLKSPQHTCRIRLLREAFPGAQFVHIHRDPFVVFPSTKRMLTTFLRSTQLQSYDPESLDERILRTYREMYDVHFEERAALRPGEVCEIGYEALEADPVGEMERLYAELGLPDFDRVRARVEEHVRGWAGYRKNRFHELPERLKDRIRQEWRSTIDVWGCKDAPERAEPVPEDAPAA